MDKDAETSRELGEDFKAFFSFFFFFVWKISQGISFGFWSQGLLQITVKLQLELLRQLHSLNSTANKFFPRGNVTDQKLLKAYTR
jgi:hypothetical protein